MVKTRAPRTRWMWGEALFGYALSLNNIANWLTGGGYLILNYNPTVRFYAKAYPQIDISRLG